MRAAQQNNKNIELISLHRRLYICFRFFGEAKTNSFKELLSAVLKSRLKDFFLGTWHARNTPRWVIFSVCAGNSFAQTTNLCCLQGTILRWKNLMNNIFPLRWEGNLRTIVIGFDGEDLQCSDRILLGDNKHRLGLQALPLFLCIFVWLKICQEKEAWETPQKRVKTRSMHI